MYLCRPSEASTRYCVIPGGYPPQDWQSLPCAGEELDSNPGLLICSQVRYHWATSPPQIVDCRHYTRTVDLSSLTEDSEHQPWRDQKMQEWPSSEYLSSHGRLMVILDKINHRKNSATVQVGKKSEKRREQVRGIGLESWQGSTAVSRHKGTNSRPFLGTVCSGEDQGELERRKTPVAFRAVNSASAIRSFFGSNCRALQKTEQPVVSR